MDRYRDRDRRGRDRYEDNRLFNDFFRDDDDYRRGRSDRRDHHRRHDRDDCRCRDMRRY